LVALFDTLVFSGVWAAGVAAMLVCAASQALDGSPRWDVVALAFTGALVVYPLDRLRDLERDRARVPLRSTFVDRHRRLLKGLVFLAGLASLALAWRLDAAIWILCGGVFVIGVFHRRLKRIGRGKTIYVSLAWTIVVVGLPALVQRPFPSSRLPWVAAVVFAAVFSNLVASNLAVKGERCPSAENWPQPQGRWMALTTAILGTALGLLGPAPALSAVPCAQALALLRHREGERHAQGVIDGALLVGGLVAIGLLWMAG
jgi:4-hydroxybenzoate polyprenyltransferase